MKKFIRFAIFLFWIIVYTPELRASKLYQVEGTLSIQSIVLNERMNFRVLLPADYTSDTLTYPVIYLLHGYGGDENSWLHRCDVEHLMDSLTTTGDIPPSVVVMPEARNSYYIDDYQHRFDMGRYFSEEFIPYIKQHYRITNRTQYHLVAGLSMGGYGAVMLSLKNPGTFGTCINLSGAVRTDSILSKLSQSSYNKYYGELLGMSLQGSNRITDHWKCNSPYHILSDSLASLARQQNWYFDCGMYDFLFPANEALHQLFMDKNIPHEYHMRIGKHQWQYWRTGFINGLIFWGDTLEK